MSALLRGCTRKRTLLSPVELLARLSGISGCSLPPLCEPSVHPTVTSAAVLIEPETGPVHSEKILWKVPGGSVAPGGPKVISPIAVPKVFTGISLDERIPWSN